MLADPAVQADPANASILDLLQGNGSGGGSGGGLSSTLDDTSFLQQADERLARPFFVGFSESMDHIFLIGSIVLVAAFLLLRGLNLYGDPRPWSAPGGEPGARPQLPALLSFLNTTKYPASLDFLLMTLGPTIAAIPAAEGARGAWARWFTVLGRVPFFFYLLHLPLVHGLALVVSLLREGSVNPWLFTNHPMGNPPAPEGYAWGLPLLYAVWAVAVGLLLVLCRWFAGVKARRADWWLRYL